MVGTSLRPGAGLRLAPDAVRYLLTSGIIVVLALDEPGVSFCCWLFYILRA